MATRAEIFEHFERQAGYCAALGSPFTARLCRALPGLLDPSTRFGARILGWRGDPTADAVALRAAGALNGLARSGRAPKLAAVWPPAAADGLEEALSATIPANDAALAPWLDGPPQTNEVARSGVLLGGCLEAARLSDLPLDLLEIGASAGLNLHLDAWRYDLGVGRWGAADAPVTIACDWRGAAPNLATPLRILSRAGADRSPLDAASQEARARMLAYIWADQPARRARAEAALLHAASSGVRVERADAADWTRARLASPAPGGRARVFMHSIMWTYLPPETRDAIRAALRLAGDRATDDAPLFWLRMEAEGDPAHAILRLTRWPGGVERMLARADYHGRWAVWE